MSEPPSAVLDFGLVAGAAFETGLRQPLVDRRDLHAGDDGGGGC